MATLKGKTLIITGASRGLGAAIARRAGQDGANVVIIGKTAEPHPRLEGTIHTVAEEVEKLGGHALPYQLDIRDDAGIEAVVKATVKKFGGIDILVNNASALSISNTMATPVKRFDLMWGVNVRASFAFARACVPHLQQAENPHILTISPPLNMKPKWFKDALPYTITKYGMSMCTLGMAEEFKAEGIGINSLWPKTLIATAAVKVHFPPEMLKASRYDTIVGDAAHEILIQDAKATTGNFLLDEEVLRSAGVTDFDKYALTPGVPLYPDLYLD